MLNAPIIIYSTTGPYSCYLLIHNWEWLKHSMLQMHSITRIKHFLLIKQSLVCQGYMFILCRICHQSLITACVISLCQIYIVLSQFQRDEGVYPSSHIQSSATEARCVFKMSILILLSCQSLSLGDLCPTLLHSPSVYSSFPSYSPSVVWCSTYIIPYSRLSFMLM